ncbi:phosphoribosyltransferase-like protein, partial [Aestuariivita boseongensis]|uniref:phosphoribosyltransferase-like protein n=1 Tax=Aestuariivita boseongensis TaxID=1470562 RepID=UPI001C11C159
MTNWANQFPEGQRAQILTCVENALSVCYFSKSEAESWLKEVVKNEEFSGSDPAGFWKSANLLNIQARGRSQREMLVILGSGPID